MRLACTAFLLLSWASWVEANPPSLTRLADGVYVHLVSPDSDAVSNSGVIVLEKSVLVFDTHFTAEAGRDLFSQISRTTYFPVRYIVQSHFHPDHTHGNQSFFGIQQIIGSTNTRRDMLQRDLPSLNRIKEIAQRQIDLANRDFEKLQDVFRRAELSAHVRARQRFVDSLSNIRILAPVVTIDDKLVIVDRRRRVEILNLGHGHTEGDVMLLLPRERIAFLGDLFFNEAIPSTEDANLHGWMKILREILSLPADVFVPGHGPVGSKQEVQRFLQYFEELKALVEPAVTRGDTLEQVVSDVQIPGRFAYYDFQNFFPSNVQKMYSEVKAIRLSEEASDSADEKKP